MNSKGIFLIYPMMLLTSSILAQSVSLEEAERLQDRAIDVCRTNPSKGIALIEKSLAITKQILGSQHPKVADGWGFLAGRYRMWNDYNKEITCLEEAISIYEKNQDASMYYSIYSLADVYYKLDNYSKAVTVLEKAVDQMNCTPGLMDIKRSIYQALGKYYKKLGNYANAIKYYEIALTIIEKEGGDLNTYLIDVLNGLGDAYHALGDYSKEVFYYEKALSHIEKEGGPPGPVTAMCWRRLAKGYMDSGDYQKAISIFEKSLGVDEQILKMGINSPNAAVDLENIGFCYARNGEYSKAISCFEKALVIDKKILGTQDPVTVRVLQILGIINYLNGNLDRSQAYSISASESLERQFQMILSMDEKTRLSWVINNLHFGVEPCFLKPEQIANQIIQRKAVVLDSLMEDRSLALLSAKDKNAHKQLDEIGTIRSKLTKIGFSSKREDQKQAEQCEERISKLQRSLSSRVSASRRIRVNARIPVEFLSASLSNGEYLLDFIQFSDPKLKDDQNCYGALMIGQDGVPKLVRMNGAREIDKSIKLLHAALASGDEKILANQQRMLTEKLWGPIAAQLPVDTKKLVIGPDGELSFLSFAALQDTSGKFLLESYEIAYVGTGRDLIRQVKGEKNKRIALFANPNFDLKSVSVSKNTLALRSGELSEFAKIALPQLPGTQVESEIIQQEAKDAGWEVTAFSGADATKQHLLELNNLGILHMATHGFYLNSLSSVEGNNRAFKVVGVTSDSPPTPLMKGVDPMRASGVALTGAQATLKAWSDGKVPDSLNDGILTAEEVSGLNLDGTWLVTLSACESGVGEAKSGEGVFGLRRAFMMAGAQNLLMTLWPVNDETTAKIMADFYKEALATHDAAGSLAKVQRDWLVKLRKEKGLLAAVRDAGPFAMVVMANPNAKPLPEATPAKVFASDTVSPVVTAPPDSSRASIAILEFNDALAKADAGDANAQAIVSIYYALGYKTEKDLAKATEYASKSSAKNNSLGQYQLGVLTTGGDGVVKDPQKGKELKIQAIEGLNTMSDDPYALAARGAMALRGEGVAKDMKKAAKLYKRSADLGYAPAQVLYSMMLTKGVGVSPDTSAARKYASMAEAQNYHP
jgi:CHAT domain-containing protein/Tfp pilus assembly protein PilF